MIFKIHYFSFNAGLSGVLVLITVFLRKYSDASSTEVGTLLMVLPFVAVFTKPFFCALADRHRKYRLYFILALLFTLIGFGSYTVLPFYPHFIAAHGRACWYMLVGATIIGYIAYGVVWSLGDAYAANVAHKTGESFGMIRLWGTIGWGVAGACVGAISPYLQLPEMVLGFIIFIVSHVFEIALLIWWPNGQDFEMGDAIASHAPDTGARALEIAAAAPPSAEATTIDYNNCCCLASNKLATITEKPPLKTTTMTTTTAPEVGNAQPNFNDDASGFISINLIEQIKSGQLQICRTNSNSLAIMTKIKLAASNETTSGLPISGVETAQQLNKRLGELVMSCGQACGGGATRENCKKDKAAEEEEERKRIADLQTTIFKMVALKHKSLIKYLIIFVALGTVYNIHWSYFFLHLDQLASEGKGADFSTLVGMCLVAQAIGETFCFAIAPWVVGKLGRDGAISLNAIAYAVRYYGNGLGIPYVSPYVAVLTESLQGINYGIFYYLITDTALHYALLVDDVIPELHARGLLAKGADLGQVRTSLRATMQGVFSGAFDGLGFGLGSLIAGLVLERHSYEQLWCYAGGAAVAIFTVHAIYELANRAIRRRMRTLRSYKREIERINAALDS